MTRWKTIKDGKEEGFTHKSASLQRERHFPFLSTTMVYVVAKNQETSDGSKERPQIARRGLV